MNPIDAAMKITIDLSEDVLSDAIKKSINSGARLSAGISEGILFAIREKAASIVSEQLTQPWLDDLLREKINATLDSTISNLIETYGDYRVKAMVELEGNRRGFILEPVQHAMAILGRAGYSVNKVEP